MTWSRFDDNTSESSEWTHVSFEARWHYFALVQFCSRGKYWAGVIPYNRALGCSDVSDPESCHAELESIGRVTRNVRTNVQGNSSKNSSGFVTLTVTRIDTHVPPPSVREGNEQAKARMQRKRAHDKGNHSFCDPSKCPDAQGVTRTVPMNRKDRTGQDSLKGEHMKTVDDDEPSTPACSVCGQPMVLVEPNQTSHPGCEKPRTDFMGGPVNWDSGLKAMTR